MYVDCQIKGKTFLKSLRFHRATKQLHRGGIIIVIIMSKIYPAERQKCSTSTKPSSSSRTTDERNQPTVLTVWKRSSMSFQGTDGFTVFDDRGNLVFRVDNYTRKIWSYGGGGLLLMDGSGKALLTLKPQVGKSSSSSSSSSVFSRRDFFFPFF